jgi:LEA14-like dessication related protein
MNRCTVLILWAAVALTALGGCVSFRGLVQKPTARFAGMSLEHLTLFEATPSFHFEVKNPNPFGITVKTVSYHLKINDQKFVNGVVDKGIHLGGLGTLVVDVPVTLSYLDLFATFSEFEQSDEVIYDIGGTITVGPFKIPYQTEGTLFVPRIPRITLQQVAVKNVSIAGAEVLFTIDIENDNPFAVTLNGLHYGIKLAGREFATGEMEALAPIEQNGITTLRIPMDVNFFKLGASVYKLLKETSSGYELSGEMSFDVPQEGEKRVPFRQLGNVPLSK